MNKKYHGLPIELVGYADLGINGRDCTENRDTYADGYVDGCSAMRRKIVEIFGEQEEVKVFLK